MDENYYKTIRIGERGICAYCGKTSELQKWSMGYGFCSSSCEYDWKKNSPNSPYRDQNSSSSGRGKPATSTSENTVNANVESSNEPIEPVVDSNGIVIKSDNPFLLGMKVGQRGEWEEVLDDPNKLAEYKFEVERITIKYKISLVAFSLLSLTYTIILLTNIISIKHNGNSILTILISTFLYVLFIVISKKLKLSNMLKIWYRHIIVLLRYPFGKYYFKKGNKLEKIFLNGPSALSEYSQLSDFCAIIKDLSDKVMYARLEVPKTYVSRKRRTLFNDGSSSYSEGFMYHIYTYGWQFWHYNNAFKKIVLSNKNIASFLRAVRRLYFWQDILIRMKSFGRKECNLEWVIRKIAVKQYNAGLLKSSK